jgi:AcrR family transcriptional regulator
MEQFEVSNGRAAKSRQTKQHIFEAAEELLKKGGYEQLSVRNICSLANVSNGSFYHYFRSKDDMLAEFLMQNHETRNDEQDETLPLLEYIVAKYMHHVDDCFRMGIEFTANYYNPKNQSFNVYTRRPGDYPIDLYGPKIAEAQGQGLITSSIPVFNILEDIRSIVIGNVFIWCSSGGLFDLKGNLERMLRQYLTTIFTDKYFETIK